MAQMDAKVAWQAVVAVNMGEFELGLAFAELLTSLDSDLINATKAVLNAAGVVEGEPLEYNSGWGERDEVALRALAIAAGVNMGEEVDAGSDEEPVAVPDDEAKKT